MKLIMFDGTPEEFQKVAPIFGPSSQTDKGSGSESVGKESPIDPQEAIRRMLTRIRVPNGQLAIYKALANGRLEYSEFLKQTGRSGAQMAGVLGALGRRVDHTPEIHRAGLPGNSGAVLKLEEEDGKRFISLQPDALKVLREANVI